MANDELIYTSLSMSDWNTVIASASAHADWLASSGTNSKAASQLFKVIVNLHAQVHHSELRSNEQ